jgi:ABC-2 type transport system permease protein
MKPILAMAIKDLRLLLRDRTGFFVTFVFPLVYAVFFGIIFKSTNVYIPRGGEGMDVILPENRYAAAFPLGIMWGVLGCTATFGLSLVVERTRGTLLRLCIAPINRAQILAGKAGACLLTAFSLGIMLFLLAYTLFDVRPHSIRALTMALASISIAFVGLMMFLSVFGGTEQSASGITWTVLLAVAMLGGGMVPRFLMPTWLQNIGDLSPVRWSLLAMDGAVWRGFTAAEMAGPCLILIAFGAVLFALGALAFRWTHREL